MVHWTSESVHLLPPQQLFYDVSYIYADVGHLHEIDDELMRFFDKCQRFVEGVENNPSALMEVKLFKASAAMQKVQRKMADRLRAPYDLVTPGEKPH